MTTAIPSEVRDAARRGEPDRYIAATLAPAEATAALVAIAAFSAELARIPATVSEAMLGDIRLQWWRDTLVAGRRGSRSGHPVADALIEAEQRHGLAAPLLEGMIDARELDLSGGLPADDAGLDAYLAATEGHAFQLALAVLGVDAQRAEPFAHAAARAFGIARGLGRLPMLVHNGGVILPADRVKAAGLDPSRLAETPPPAQASDAVARVAEELRHRARAALDVVRGELGSLRGAARVAMLPLAMVEPYLRAQSGRLVLTEMSDVSPLSRVLRIGIAHLTGRL